MSDGTLALGALALLTLCLALVCFGVGAVGYGIGYTIAACLFGMAAILNHARAR